MCHRVGKLAVLFLIFYNVTLRYCASPKKYTHKTFLLLFVWGTLSNSNAVKGKWMIQHSNGYITGFTSVSGTFMLSTKRISHFCLLYPSHLRFSLSPFPLQTLHFKHRHLMPGKKKEWENVKWIQSHKSFCLIVTQKITLHPIWEGTATTPFLVWSFQ